MPYLGSSPPETALEADDIASNAVTTAKIANDAVDTDKINLVSTGSTPSLEAKGTSGVSEGYIQLYCAENSHGIKLKSPPHSAAQSYTLTYPSAIVDGGFMKTDSSGNLSFAAAGGLTIESEQATTSGSSVTFGSIPSGTKRIHIMIEGVSSGGGNDIEIQLGDAGGIETSGYNGCAMRAHGDNGTGVNASNAATIVESTGAGDTFDGMVTCVLKDSTNHTWVMSGGAGDNTGSGTATFMGFSKTLSAELTQVKVLSEGTYDAGSIAISYD